MKVAVVQPYLFPYLGYYQLVNMVDKFVFFDDVNYIKKGYINRNNILINGKPFRFTLPLISASQNKIINEIDCSEDYSKLLKTVKQAYSHAPYYLDVMDLIVDVICSKNRNLSYVSSMSIISVFDYLGLEKDFLYSSNIDYKKNVPGEEKIIEICKSLGASEYINPVGGVSLYSRNNFIKNNMELSFIEKYSYAYNQCDSDFIDNLSMIDVLMWNSKEEVIELLKKYRTFRNE